MFFSKDLYFRADINTVEYLINQSTEVKDEGLYVCNVTSTSGFDSGKINVDVLGKFERKFPIVPLLFGLKINSIAPSPFIQIIPSKSLFALINSTISIHCLVQSTKDYRLIWKQELSSSVLIEPIDDRIRIFQNGTLKFT